MNKMRTGGGRGSKKSAMLQAVANATGFFGNVICKGCSLDLSEFKVNVMTRNNEAYQRYPYDPGIQKCPFFFVQTPEF